MRARHVASALVLTVFSGFVILSVLRHGDDFGRLLSLDWKFILILFLLYALLLALNGVIIRLLVNKLGCRITFGDGLFLSALTQFSNYFLPFRGGTAVRAAYLKKVHGFDFTKFIATLGGYYITLFLVVSAATLATSGFLYVTEEIFSPPAVLLYALLLAGLILLTACPPREDSLPTWAPAALSRVIKGWALLRSDTALIGRLLLLNVFIVVIGSSFIQAFFAAIEVPLPFSHALFMHLIPYVSFFINITPASVGVYDGVFFWAAHVLAIPTPEALMFLMVFRSISLTVSAAVVFFLGGKPFMRRQRGGRRGEADETAD